MTIKHIKILLNLTEVQVKRSIMNDYKRHKFMVTSIQIKQTNKQTLSILYQNYMTYTN